MRDVALSAVIYLLLLACVTLAFPSADPPTPSAVYFSPHGGCTAAIVAEIGAARQSVEVEAYSFTARPIAEALIAAGRRGVTVTVILDAKLSRERQSQAGALRQAGISTLLDAQHAIAHNKVLLLDGATVITGSFNFTDAAEERNAENLLILHDPEIARKYQAEWARHLGHSRAKL